MTKMQLNNSYHGEEVHKNVQKVISDGMENVGVYTKEENNVLRRNNSKTDFTVRLHFTEENDSNKIVEDVQKILIGTYVRGLTSSKGGK